jgi:hypothetical protein
MRSAMKTRIALATSVGLNLILLIALAMGSVTGSRSYVVDLAPDLTTRLVPTQVADIAMGRLEAMASEAANVGMARPAASQIRHLISVRKEDLPSVEPRIAGIDGEGPFWVVRAEGTFFTNRGRSMQPRVYGSGYFVVDDALGIVIAMGMP